MYAYLHIVSLGNYDERSALCHKAPFTIMVNSKFEKFSKIVFLDKIIKQSVLQQYTSEYKEVLLNSSPFRILPSTV